MTHTMKQQLASARQRLSVALAVGLLTTVGCIALGAGRYTPLVSWDTTLLTYSCWLWLNVWPMGASETKSHAVSEDPGRALADALLLLASVASIGAVAILVIDAANSTGAAKALDIIIGLTSIVLSWGVVHTIYMLRYARAYYGHPEGGINFNEQAAPRYTDFAYLAFTLGMTFQVSDTNLQTKAIRVTALKHALLSYLFGAVIIAITINTLATLSQ